MLAPALARLSLALVALPLAIPPSAAQPQWTPVEGLAAGAGSAAVNPQNPRTVWFGAQFGRLHVSRDGGGSIAATVQLPFGNAEGDIVTAHFVHPEDTLFVMAGTPRGAYLSRDGGATWSHALPDHRVRLNGVSIASEPGRADTLYVGVLRNLDTPEANLFRSFDRGHTWERLSVPLGVPGAGFCSIAAGGGGVLLAGSNARGGVVRSEDYGATWALVHTSELGAHWDVPRAVFDPRDPSVAWAAIFNFIGPGYVARSADGGRTWARTALDGVDPWALDVDGSGRAYVGAWVWGRSGAYVTADGGATWDLLALPDVPPDVDAVVWQLLWDAATGHVFLADGTSGAWRLDGMVTSDEPSVPHGVAHLGPAAPNPTAHRTTLPLVLERPEAVTVVAYDALGRRVGVLLSGLLGAGRHDVVLDATLLPAGTYLVRAQVGAASTVRRVTVAH